MRGSLPSVRGFFLLGAYLCLIALMFVVPEHMTWLKQVAQWIALPLLILFFYLNTAIDSKFEKSIFYGIGLFALSVPLPLAKSVLGGYTLYLLMGIWLIGYFSYARALISIVSMSSSFFFKQKIAAAIVFVGGIVGIYLLIRGIGDAGNSIFPWVCFGLACLIYLMSTINLRGQLHRLPASLFLVGAILLIVFNCLFALNISDNISIFESKSSMLFYLGQLIVVFAATRCSIQFRNNNYTDISSVLTKK